MYQKSVSGKQKRAFKGKLQKAIAVFLAINILAEVVFPTCVYALTSSVASPEFSNFTPVSSSDLVNVFSGDFSYNLPVLDIPGPDGAGYALSLAYQNGNSSEDESSWVGNGWSLSPGAINRGTRGFPDDYNGEIVYQYNKSRPNWSSSIVKSVGLESYSNDFPVGLNNSVRFNNYQGYTKALGLTLNVKGLTSLTMQATPQGVTFNAAINIPGLLSRLKNKKKKEDNAPEKKNDEEVSEKKSSKIKDFLKQYSLKSSLKKNAGFFMKAIGSTAGINSFSEVAAPDVTTRYSGIGYNWSKGITINPTPALIGMQTGKMGNFNMQWTEPSFPIRAYGFMHNQPTGYKNAIGDYYVEKGNPYSKRDIFIGIPFNNADNFVVTGEGLTGGFRYYPKAPVTFYPSHVKSKTVIKNMGVEGNVGVAIGVGVDLGVGFHTTSSKEWKGDYNEEPSKVNTDGLFRFTNDMGGKVEYGGNGIASSWLDVTNEVPTIKSCALKSDASLRESTVEGGSSYIKKLGNESKIEGFAITNEDGQDYVYGQGVLVRNEASLSIDIPKANKPADKFLAFSEASLNSEFKVDESKHRRVVGEVRGGQYASSFLLNQINSPDYVDVNNNGGDEADFGAWTKFDYFPLYGSNAESKEWYRFRTPYTGLHYEEGTISDRHDEMGSIQTGEKEVYYLKTVETKTHIACFITNKTDSTWFPGYASKYVTGSGVDRLDGMGAATINGTSDPAATGKKGNQKLLMLEKIVLFSKARPGKPVKTIRFSYSYELGQNLPNHVNGNFPGAKKTVNSGKLTLKKVWFEYEGTHLTKIAPYEFSYAYKDINDYAPEVISRYPEIISANTKYTSAAQNPDYNPSELDAWGNVQMYGKERKKDMNPWLYQGEYPAKREAGDTWRSRLETTGPNNQIAADFDPAAWQLKHIKLPSGGEIMVHYERKDYRYVQDRKAMAMVSLLKSEEINELGFYLKKPEYWLNLDDLGIEQNDERFEAKRNSLIGLINDYFGPDREKEKVFFKFLYNLRTGGKPLLDECSSEYISGYGKLRKCVKETLPGGKKTIKLVLEGENPKDGEYAYVPRQACYDFATTQRWGKDATEDCEAEYESRYDDKVKEAAEKQDLGLAKFGIAALIMSDMGSLIDGETPFGMAPKTEACTYLNSQLSYIKLPMLHAKRGGGIRVKRVMMYDPGMETGDAALYGSEYIYQDENGQSSGVATTEPSSMREENPLVTFMPRKGQSWYNRITTGEDREQTEGPIGESILPVASVGHSRVVIKNIHAGKTGTGFTVHEFYTAKDYPFDGNYRIGKGVDFTDLSDNKLQDKLPIPVMAGPIFLGMSKLWMAQGFRFIINNMHGQNKKVSVYGGDYKNPEKAYLISSQGYEYFEPGEKVKLIEYVDGKYEVSEDIPGIEMDVAQEERAMFENAKDISIEVDLAVDISPTPIPKPQLGLYPSLFLGRSFKKTHATSKVIRYPVIIKSVTSFRDGVYGVTENIAFNKHNGKPVVTRNADSFDKVVIKGKKHDGSIYTTSIPASWHYPSMGPKSRNVENTNQLHAQAGQIVSYSTHGNPLQKGWFTSPKNVMSASVQTFKNNWAEDNDELLEQEYGQNAHKEAINKKWRPWQTFLYKDSTRSANKEKIYTGGVYKSFSMYWSNPTNPKWIKATEVTKYSPNGMALEEKNVLGIYSAARFGYANKALPTMVAQNSDYSSIYFEDYENSTAAIEGGHSGSKSLKVSTGENIINLSHLYSYSRLKAKGGILKLWVKEPAFAPALNLKVTIGSATLAMEKVASTGDWTLYSVTVPKESFTTPGLSCSLTFTGSTLQIDDVRLQPTESDVKCFVYDISTLRTLAEFDDQHFGLYYQYNDEGKLVRKMIETERGMKTVQETQYHFKKMIE